MSLHRIRPFLPALIWTVIVTALSAMPGTFIPSFRWSDLLSLDKLAHATVYCLLSLLIFRGFSSWRHRQSPAPRTVLIAVGFSCCWGAGMEWMQGTFFPGRAFELLDMLANCTGAFLAWGIVLMYFRKG